MATRKTTAAKAPTKTTRSTRVARQKAAFITALSERGIVKYAVLAVKPSVNRCTFYTWRDDDPKFAEAWERALEDATDDMEAEARRRAVEGIDRALTCSKGLIYDADGNIMYERQYSDTLLAKMLAANRPKKYGNKVALTDGDGDELSIAVLFGVIAEGK